MGTTYCNTWNITQLSFTILLLFGRSDIMKWTWKHICVILFAAMLSGSAYIVKASNEESTLVPQINYYGSCENAKVEILATKDFNHFQDTLNTYSLFEYEVPNNLEQNEDMFLLGYAVLFPSIQSFDVEHDKIKISIADKKTSLKTNVLTKKDRNCTEPTREVFFYVDDAKAFEMEEITHCIITYSENEMKIDMTSFETTGTNNHPRMHEELTPST